MRNDGRCGLWIEQVQEAGEDEELLAQVLEDIFEQGVNEGLREAAATPEDE